LAQDINRPPASRPRLEVEGLTHRFGATEVVRGVNLRVFPGQVACLLGPSGCGKSTTLRLIAGVEHPTGGVIRVDGQVLSHGALHLPPEAREIGLMFQDFALFPHLSVAQNVAFGLRGRGENVAGRVAELLDRVDLARFGEKYPHELSGESSSVWHLPALAPRPRVLLMDEPFSGLDNRCVMASAMPRLRF